MRYLLTAVSTVRLSSPAGTTKFGQACAQRAYKIARSASQAVRFSWYSASDEVAEGQGRLSIKVANYIGKSLFTATQTAPSTLSKAPSCANHTKRKPLMGDGEKGRVLRMELIPHVLVGLLGRPRDFLISASKCVEDCFYLKWSESWICFQNQSNNA